MSDIIYSASGALLSSLRKAKGWTQKEFAVRAGVAPQTVSRWEQGLSRPRSKELASLATLLGAELGAMEAAAAYTLPEGGNGQPAGAPTYDVPLPLQSLRPDSFENFSADFLTCYYRSRAGVVNRFGGTGSKQHGIDIEVRGHSFGVHSFQCKRVEEFGEQKVHAAVAAHNYTSDLKILLLSNIASPKARMAIAQHAGWQLWDRVDVSAKFRELPMVDRRDLVDIYFRGQRQALLGEPEPGPFQTPEDFFKGFIEPDRYFNHCWELVGRNEELKQLTTNVLDDGLLVTMLLGAPGNGKTRLLREVVEKVRQQRPDIAIRFVSPTEDVKAQHLEELGTGAKLLVVDDAHDRDDLTQLMRYASASENKARLLLALRPYGRAMVRSQASLVAMDSPQVATVELRPRAKQDARVLATQVLQASGGPVEAAEGIAELTYPTPLVTVLAAQIVAKENTPLALIGNSENFQEHVLARLEKIIAGQIVTGQDVPKLQAVLRMVALLQPVVFDDPGFLNILREVEGLEQEDVQRLLCLLSEGGVLFKRGLRHRLAPDLLGDSIIQRNFIGANGAVTPKVEQVFDLADTEYLKHLLVNLGRLDWRLRNGETEGSTLLSSIAPKLQWHGKYHNPHIKAVEAVAYYQPRLALNFAEQLIEQNHGDESGVCGMVRNAAFNLDLLEDVCALLWRAGKGDARVLHQHPSHGIRILKEFAEFSPNKPVECVERVVTFAIDLLERPAALRGAYTPFTILESALRTDMEEVTSSNSRSITITRYKLDFALAKTVRARVIDVIVSALRDGTPRKAFLAANLLSEALRSPMHGGEDVQAWDAAHADLLARVRDALDSPTIHPVVLVKAGMSVSWHAFYNRESECGPWAQAIITLLDRDLPTRLVRLIADAWGSQTWDDDESFKRRAHEADTIKMMADLAAEFPDPVRLYEFLAHWLNEVDEVVGRGWGTPQIFINRLLQHRTDLAKVVMTRQADAQSPLSNFAGAALAVLMADQNRHTFISELLEIDSVRAWELISEAYARQEADFFTDADMSIVRRIFQSREPVVLHNAASIALQIARRNPALAVEQMCIADLTISPVATHDFFMWLAHRDTIPTEVITPEQWQTLLKGLSRMPELDDHWVREFLKKAVATVPADVIDMLKTRLLGYSRALRWDYKSDDLALLSHPDGLRLLREFLAWAVDVQAGSELAMDIGDCVSGLCGKYGSEVLDLLLELVKDGSQAHMDVVASVLSCAHQELVIDETPFIREVLNQAELISEQAVKDISSALWSSTLAGGRSGVVGEPFKEDVALHAHAEKVLCGLSKMDPAHRLYSGLLQHAKENIERQAREKRAIEEEDV
ncbi:helix-turn-helix domain-containing protein [Azotobacter chroococcum]|uniref:helix-turn-helix domain-containing protein n=1 Tax=Azotobacter chroococcum TaxID=353 RepID=UPI00103C5254|nr:helix-turn-helix domain-containing protein [Azotobacter chroococcum]TBW10548.1 helix-turn-helix domain-containing protein [Azotobacter chroococcum]